MPDYKLIYFELKGKGESIRMLLTLAGQKFEDVRFKGTQSEDWLAAKSSFPQHQLPVLVVDGKAIPQSGAILRFLGRKYGFYGDTNDESTRIDVIHGSVSDFTTHLLKWYYARNATEKAGIEKDIINIKMPGYLTILEGILLENNNGNGFFVGNKISFGDLLVFDMNDQLVDMFGKDIVDRAMPVCLSAFNRRMEEYPPLKEYLDDRTK